MEQNAEISNKARSASDASKALHDDAWQKKEPTAPAVVALDDLKVAVGIYNLSNNAALGLLNCAAEFLKLRSDVTLSPPRMERTLDAVQRDHFRYFQENQHKDTGLIYDRNNKDSPCSIAAVGFGLTCYPVAVERGWVSKEEAADWTLKVLKTLSNTPQGDTKSGTSGYNGYFYHMLDPATGTRATAPRWWDSELSSVDTALLMMGVLYAKEYFTGDDEKSKEIRSIADGLYRRVDWAWLADKDGLCHLSWSPESGKSIWQYKGYNEAIILYLLGLGSPTHPFPDKTWKQVMGQEKPERDYGQDFVHLPGNPLFTFQYPHTWIDFRKIRDENARQQGFDWFENSRRATIAQHQYAMDNPLNWRGYGKYIWGLTACDGPGPLALRIDGKELNFTGYRERGAPRGFDDGTIAPTAAMSSIAFAPNLVLPTMVHWLRQHPQIYTRHGFADAFNPTVRPPESGWVASDCIGIDQGPIMLMLENYRSERVWKTMAKNEYLRNGLKRAGFEGGWLEKR